MGEAPASRVSATKRPTVPRLAVIFMINFGKINAPRVWIEAAAVPGSGLPGLGHEEHVEFRFEGCAEEDL